MKRRKGGFTLIELLVVISIISLLSSIVFSSLNTARLKAKDAAIKNQLLELRNVYEQDYLNKSDYSGWHSKHPLSGGCAPTYLTSGSDWGFICDTTNFTCASIYSSKIISPNQEAQKICESIISIAGGNMVGTSPTFATGVPLATPSGNKNYYSIAAYLPYKKKYFCLGSGGLMSDIVGGYSQDAINSTDFNPAAAPGCWANP